MGGGKRVHVVFRYLSVDILFKDDVSVILLYCFLPEGKVGKVGIGR
jgi:hypothetical protein